MFKKNAVKFYVEYRYRNERCYQVELKSSKELAKMKANSNIEIMRVSRA